MTDIVSRHPGVQAYTLGNMGETDMPTDEKRIAEIYVRLHGAATPQISREKAVESRDRGDTFSEARWLKTAELAEQILADEKDARQRTPSIDPNIVALYGAVAGIRMESDAFDLGDGFLIRNTFAHVMAPYLMAFQPAKPGQPHPGPWRAAGGGLGFDAHVEIALPANLQPTNFNRLNTIWWIAALLRLHHAVGIRVPVVSDVAFDRAANATREPIFWPVEMSPRLFAFDGYVADAQIELTTLEWIRLHFRGGAVLMDNPEFNLAFSALDQSHWGNSVGVAKLLIWAALEALFRPGRKNITHTLSAAIATYLEDDPASRDRAYGKIKKLYEARGQITHAAEEPKIEDVVASFRLARDCFVRTIEAQATPDTPSLLTRWSTRC